MGAALRHFLARLSIDPTLLREFITRSADVIDQANLSPAERQALLSRNQSRIQASILEDSARSVAMPPRGNDRGVRRP
jgi:hypothetical protein